MPALTRATAHPYGYQHRKRRAALIPAAIGTPCPGGRVLGQVVRSPKCTRIMTNPRLMHLDHTTALAVGGTVGDRIICKPCNLTAGTTLGNLLRKHPTARRTATTHKRRLPQW